MKYIFLFILITFSILIQGQSIPSYWMNIYNLENFHETRDNNKVKEITVKKTGYYSSGKSYKTKWTYHFINKFKCRGNFSKEGELKSIFIYELDSLNQKIKIELKTKFPLLGWQRRSSEIDYLNNKRITERHYNDENVIRVGEYSYDSLNYLIKLTTMTGYETAEYNHSDHSYIYKIFTNNHELVSQEKLFANKSLDQNIKNEYGDFTKILWPTANPENKVFHTMDYKYDKHGNWTKRKRYIETNGKKKLVSKIVRKIKYK